MAYLLAVDDERDIVELISRFAEHKGHTYFVYAVSLLFLVQDRMFETLALYQKGRNTRSQKAVNTIVMKGADHGIIT